MFDAKKLLDALGPPAAPAPPAASPAPSKPAAATPLGAGTILSDLIGLANRPDPPAEAGAANGEPAPKPKAPAAPADLTDLLLGKAQEYLKTPQGNAVVGAAVAGLTKIVVNSEAGRKLGASAKSKGAALFNRFFKKPDDAALPSPVAAAPLSLAAPEPADPRATALLVMRAMVAAAAADGRIDDTERARILGAIKSAGIGADGAHIIARELDHPATPAELAAAATTPDMAIQAYTAARRVITPFTVEERVFLAHLSAAMKLDPRLVAQIDANADGLLES